MIHRDIKPANIMLCELGGQYDVVKKLDFGLVKSISPSDLNATGNRDLTGTPLYIAPERIPLRTTRCTLLKRTSTSTKAYDGGWDALREKRLQRLKELGIVARDAKAFPRLPSVMAWDELPEEERALAARDMEVYAAMVDYMDGQIKRVFDQLKAAGEYENTLIIFFSDNGANGSSLMNYPGQTNDYMSTFDNRLENRGLEKSLIDMGPGWAQASMTPSRMFKGFTAEGGIRSPLLVKLPGKMANAGTINQSFLHIRDIMPTILDAADIEQPL